MTGEPEFHIEAPADPELGETLVVGIADFGVAGLTAVDYLSGGSDLEQIGHVRTQNLPDIAPFTSGRPRYPVRIYDGDDPGLTVLLSEVFVPVWAADRLTEALFEWLASTGIEEIAVLFGAPLPHSEDEHLVSAVATDAFWERRLGDVDIEPVAGGFFDGVVGEIVTRGLAEDTPSVGVFLTPAHYPGPDLDAAIRLLDALETVYDVRIDETELRERSREMKQYYQELADRLQSLQDAETLGSRDYPEDRMFM